MEAAGSIETWYVPGQVDDVIPRDPCHIHRCQKVSLVGLVKTRKGEVRKRNAVSKQVLVGWLSEHSIEYADCAFC